MRRRGNGWRSRRAGRWGRWARWGVLLAVVVAGAAGCLDLETVAEVEPDSLWEADLLPLVRPGEDLPRVTGQAAFLVRGGATQVGLGLAGVDQELRWGVFRQTCTDPGDLLATAEAYPVIPDSASQLEVSLPVPLSEDGTYHIRLGTDAPTTSSVACGNLEQVDQP